MPKNTRLQILQVAQNLMAEKNYSAVSMSEIAAEVGIAKSSLYHFFKDKESLYAEIITAYIQNAIKIYSYNSNERPSKKILSTKIKKAIVSGEKNGGTLSSFENIKWSKEKARKIQESFEDLYYTLHKTLKDTKISNPEFSAHLILDMSYAYIKKNKCGKKIWKVDEFTNLLIKHLYV